MGRQGWGTPPACLDVVHRPRCSLFANVIKIFLEGRWTERCSLSSSLFQFVDFAGEQLVPLHSSAKLSQLDRSSPFGGHSLWMLLAKPNQLDHSSPLRQIIQHGI